MAKKQKTTTVSRKQRREQVAAAQKARNMRFGIVGLVALIAIVATVLIVSQSGTVADDFEGELAGTIYDGSPDAPIQIVEYGDFGCHACRAWHNAGIKDRLKQIYGDQIAFQFRHFPIITPNSPLAAQAGQCAAEQDNFWAYHDYVYESTQEGALSNANLKQYAADINLDSTAFDQCLDSGRYIRAVNNDLQSARQAGARGTPTFLINNEQVNFSEASMIAKIDQLLDS